MSKKKVQTVEYWQNKLNEVNPNLIIKDKEIIDGYQKQSTIYCKECEKTYLAIPRSFIRNGGKCLICGEEGYWEKPIHKKEKEEREKQGRENCDQTCGQAIYKKTLATERPDLIKYFENKEDANSVTEFSNEIVNLKCPKCGTPKITQVSNLSQRGFFCDICDHSSGKARTTESFKSELQQNNPHLHLFSEINGSKEDVVLYCDECNNYFNITPTKLQTRQYSCPVCSNKTCYGEDKITTKSRLILGVNTVFDLRKDLIKFFKNQEDAKNFTLGSYEEVQLICPDCGKERTMKINQLTHDGFNCHYCSDGVSYPNKLLHQLLFLRKGFVEKFDFEYKDSWTNDKKYDGYFKLNGIEYLCEMHGSPHYQDAWNSVEEVQENDRYKEELAKKNRYNLIVIDCRIEIFSYIVPNIKASKLQELLNFSEEEYIAAGEQAEKSLVKKACELYNKKYKIKEIVEELKLCSATVETYLKRGQEIGLVQGYIDENGKKVGAQNRRRTPVIIYNSENEIVSECPRINDAVQWVKDNLNLIVRSNTIKNRCVSGKEYHGYYFGYPKKE